MKRKIIVCIITGLVAAASVFTGVEILDSSAENALAKGVCNSATTPIHQDNTKVEIVECGDTILIQDKLTHNFYTIADKTTEEKYVVAKKGLNARTFPNHSYSNVNQIIPYGKKVQLFGMCGDWAVIKDGDEILFCWDKYLSTKNPKKKKPKVKVKTEKKDISENISTSLYSSMEFRSLGVVYWGDWRWTWYSQNVLPGGGLNIPGRHVDSSGYVCDGNGYICLASSVIPKGTILSTPFGKMGKIYDSGCAPNTVDVYVNF